ncbi:uncharacterized protein F5Z01DRAFT_691427 [Emericellopsis atlantica]|uniref:Uncharacterized protein n=1 Tax=Emericellopsis atlantica TaxID=2614577 RepID=A0A9P7ZGU0_9HYPO|nr:uncharacterized protein F5Z01DRAFT_691427 [Emericellopsis atlantica]KAG9251888.1 hypothetical protein F5Z01DRAFT_691427 [Emericellopsis atlantica]
MGARGYEESKIISSALKSAITVEQVKRGGPAALNDMMFLTRVHARSDALHCTGSAHSTTMATAVSMSISFGMPFELANLSPAMTPVDSKAGMAGAMVVGSAQADTFRGVVHRQAHGKHLPLPSAPICRLPNTELQTHRSIHTTTMVGAVRSLDEVKADAQRQLEGEMQADVPLSPKRRPQSLREVGMAAPPQQSAHRASDPGADTRPVVARPISFLNIYPQTLILRGKYVMVQRPVGETNSLDCIFELDAPAGELDRDLGLVLMRKRGHLDAAAGAVVYRLHRTPDKEARNFLIPQYRATKARACQELSLNYGRIKSMFGKQYFKVVLREQVGKTYTVRSQKILSTKQHEEDLEDRIIATEHYMVPGNAAEPPPDGKLVIHHPLTEQERAQLVAVWILRIWADRAGRMTVRRTWMDWLRKLTGQPTQARQGRDDHNDAQNPVQPAP